MSHMSEEGPSSSSVEVFVPGRLCVLGEHTDWMTQGATIVCTTSEGIFATASKTSTTAPHTYVRF